MSIWSTPLINAIECGAACKECGEIITDNPDGETITCDECKGENENENRN